MAISARLTAKLVPATLKDIPTLAFRRINPEDIVINGVRLMRTSYLKQYHAPTGFMRYSFYSTWDPAKSELPTPQYEIWLKEKYQEGSEHFRPEQKNIVDIVESLLKNLSTGISEPITSVQKWLVEKAAFKYTAS